MKTARRIAAVCGLAATLAVAASCIADLDPPATCPPDAKFPGKSCAEILTNPVPGCMTFHDMTPTPERVACLTGPRDDCRCTSTDCPPRDGACYPDGDCPPAVTDRVADASCKRLLPEDVGADLPTGSMCMCMCAGCAAVCDGVGPVVGAVTINHGPKSPDNFEPYPILFDIGRRMPAHGRLGIYLRVRGLANLQVLLYKGDISKLNELTPIQDPIYTVLNELSTEFSDQVLSSDPFLALKAYEWKTAADKPTAIAVYATPFGSADGAQALFELDCLVPFVIPS